MCEQTGPLVAASVKLENAEKIMPVRNRIIPMSPIQVDMNSALY